MTKKHMTKTMSGKSNNNNGKDLKKSNTSRYKRSQSDYNENNTSNWKELSDAYNATKKFYGN